MSTPYDTTANLPKFSKIKIEKIESHLTKTLEYNRHAITQLLQQRNPFTWNNLLRPFENLENNLNNLWSPINHLNSVVNSKALRKVYHVCLPKLSEYSTELSHNKDLFNAINMLANSDEFNFLDHAQRKVIENHIRDFKLAGVALPEKKKKRFAQLHKQLTQLTTTFEENVLDATQGWNKHITDEKELSGLPPHAIQAAAETAKRENKNGWLFTLEFPSYYAVMTYANSSKFREIMYYAYNTRASDKGPHAGKWNNSTVMLDILQRRLEIATLLNFNNFAEYSLVPKMVKQPDKVLTFLQELVNASYDKAQQEYKTLNDFSKNNFGTKALNAWDVGYYSEKLRQQRYAITQEELRPYFPETRVVQGLFTIVNKLFDLHIEEIKDVDRWHPDVRCYAIYDAQGNLRSQFYFDLYARPNKRGGAWMDECHVRRKLDDGRIQRPIAFITCNFDRPIDGNPALFTHDEVVTLFHEFGHALQHMLTKIDYMDVSGINGIPWDAVEVASQFFENWAWEKESIHLISGHYQTNQPLPDDLLIKMRKARNFQSGMQMIRQLELALFDFRLHMEFDPRVDNQIQNILDEIRSYISVVPVPKFNRFQHSFSHIFAGGYAAGYYSYKWAEVMAADAFSLFKEKGIFDKGASQKFLTTFLESGGAVDPLDLFIEFRGREPRVDALLERSGIIKVNGD